MKDTQLLVYTGAFTTSVGIGVQNLIAAVPGYRIRVLGFSIGSNALNNVMFVNITGGAGIYTQFYGLTTYGRGYSEHAGGDNFLFESANDSGIGLYHNGGSVPMGVSIQYKLIPNGF